MKTTRALVSASIAAVLSLGTIAALAPAASAEDTPPNSTCTQAQRTELRQEIAELHGKIYDLRLSPQEIADTRAAHQQAVADLRAEYGLPGATLTEEQRAELKAKMQALRDAARQVTADRRAEINPLKAQILAARSELVSCRAAGKAPQS